VPDTACTVPVTLASGTSLFWHQGDWQVAPFVDDRSSQFGEGLFETMRTDSRGSLPLWSWHRQRLQEGCERLHFPETALVDVETSLQQLTLPTSAGVKLLVSRGSSRQGYGYQRDGHVNLRWSAFVAPEWRVRQQPQGLCIGVNPVCLSPQPLLAGLKHTNRLEQVLARGAFEPGWDESLMRLQQSDQVVEGTMSNLIWLEKGQALTPRVDQAGVNGVIRRWLMSQHVMTEAECTLARLKAADGVILTNSIMGLVPVSQLEQTGFDRHNSSTSQLMTYQQSLEAMF